VAFLGDDMVVNISKEDLDLIELNKLAEKGISQEELEDVVSEYEQVSRKQTTQQSFEAKKEEYKREKAKTNFEQGLGGFKRSQ